jgi:hypothetical protein
MSTASCDPCTTPHVAVSSSRSSGATGRSLRWLSGGNQLRQVDVEDQAEMRQRSHAGCGPRRLQGAYRRRVHLELEGERPLGHPAQSSPMPQIRCDAAKRCFFPLIELLRHHARPSKATRCLIKREPLHSSFVTRKCDGERRGTSRTTCGAAGGGFSLTPRLAGDRLVSLLHVAGNSQRLSPSPRELHRLRWRVRRETGKVGVES